MVEPAGMELKSKASRPRRIEPDACPFLPTYRNGPAPLLSDPDALSKRVLSLMGFRLTVVSSNRFSNASTPNGDVLPGCTHFRHPLRPLCLRKDSLPIKHVMMPPLADETGINKMKSMPGLYPSFVQIIKVFQAFLR